MCLSKSLAGSRGWNECIRSMKAYSHWVYWGQEGRDRVVVQVLQGWHYKYYKGGITSCDYRMGAGITPDCALGDKTPYKDISNSNSIMSWNISLTGPAVSFFCCPSFPMLGDKTPSKDFPNSNSMSPCAVHWDFSNATMPTYSHKILTNNNDQT